MERSGAERERTFEELCELVAPIAERHGMLRIYLFGSRARGDHTGGSDYDFCVLPDASCSLIRLSSFLLDLKDALGHDVDIVCEDSVKEDFSKTIEADRRLVCEA